MGCRGRSSRASCGRFQRSETSRSRARESDLHSLSSTRRTRRVSATPIQNEMLATAQRIATSLVKSNAGFPNCVFFKGESGSYERYANMVNTVDVSIAGLNVFPSQCCARSCVSSRAAVRCGPTPPSSRSRVRRRQSGSTSQAALKTAATRARTTAANPCRSLRWPLSPIGIGSCRLEQSDEFHHSRKAGMEMTKRAAVRPPETVP